jgi:hypothetical protein
MTIIGCDFHTRYQHIAMVEESFFFSSFNGIDLSERISLFNYLPIHSNAI